MADQNSTRLLDIAALANGAEPTEALQYSVVDVDGKRHVYGDQHWVRSGQCLEDAHPGGRIERRVVLITYGDWMS